MPRALLHLRACAPLVALAITLVHSVALAQSFTLLGELPGGAVGSFGESVSDDGRFVTGGSNSTAGFEAYRWEQGVGMVGLGDFAGSAVLSQGSAISADGSAIAGSGSVSLAFDVGFLWTTASMSLAPIESMPGAGATSALGISGDGSTVTGTMGPGLAEMAFIWRDADGLLPLSGASMLFSEGSEGIELTPDGSTIVGVGFLGAPTFAQQAFVWDEGGSVQTLPDLLPGDPDSGGAFGISTDGRVIVGQSLGGSGNVEAVRWVDRGMPESLGIPAGAVRARGDATTSDGAIVVGNASNSDFSVQIPFIWDSQAGLRTLSDFAENELGLDLDGWTLEEVNDISPDGNFIVGTAGDPESPQMQAFLISVPEPGALSSGLAALLWLTLVAKGRSGRTSR